MSINFSELGREEREIRCLVVQNLNKRIDVIYDNVENFKKQFGQKVVTVYEPTSEQHDMILDLINKGLDEDENLKELKIKGTDFILVLLKELTDIELNLNAEKDSAKIEKILKNPKDILLAVHSEINKICNTLMDRIYENMVDFSHRPEGLQKVIIQQFHESEAKNEIDEKINAEEEEKRKKIQELKEQLAQLESENNE